VCTEYTPGQVRDTLPVSAVRITIGDGAARAVVGYLPTEGWWCDVHGGRRCAHQLEALAWLARLGEATP